MKIYEIGDKIEFMLPDKKGKAHWFPGKIHGVRRYEDPKTNAIQKMTYLVDTGRDERVDERPFDRRDVEVTRRVRAERAKGKTDVEAISAVMKHTDLPESKIDVVRIRQPEQLELPAEHIRRPVG